MKLTLLFYYEHYSTAGAGETWIPIADALPERQLLTAAGLIVDENDEHVSLSVSASEEDAVTPFSIAKRAIVSRMDFDQEEVMGLVKKRSGKGEHDGG